MSDLRFVQQKMLLQENLLFQKSISETPTTISIKTHLAHNYINSKPIKTALKPTKNKILPTNQRQMYGYHDTKKPRTPAFNWVN